MDRQKKAYIYAGATVLCWSTSASAFKISLKHIEILPFLLIASLTSTSILALHLLVSGRHRLLKICTRRDYLRSALLGLLNPFLYYTILIHAYDLLPAQQAQPINFTWPITLVLLSALLLKQPLRPRDIIATAISFAGVLIISSRGHLFDLQFTSAHGVLLALASTFIWASFWIINTTDSRDEVLRLCLNFAFGTVYLSIAAVLLGRMHELTLPGVLGGAYVGVFEMGIAFLCWLKALRLSKSTALITNLIFLVPFFSLVLISIFVGETIALATVAGLILIVAGIILQRLRPRRTHR